MTLLAIKIPKYGRHGRVVIFAQADFHGPLQQLIMELMIDRSGLADTRQIAFHIGGKNRNAGLGQTFAEVLKCDCFTCTRRPCNQAMTVCERQQ